MTRVTIGRWAGRLAILGGLTIVGSPPSRAQDDPPDFEAIIARPTEHHERLKREVGTWDATVKMWMGGPDAPAEESKGVETNTLFGGGLWLLTSFEGDFGGLKFEGRGWNGYDSKKGKYVGCWVDSMTDRITPMEGTFDEATDSYTYTLEGVDPATGKPIKEHHTLKYDGDDTRIAAFYTPGPDGKEFKSMEITYKKRK